jgi:hypothetical protein
MNEAKWIDPRTDLFTKFRWLRFNKQLCAHVYSTIGVTLAIDDEVLLQRQLDQIGSEEARDRLSCIAGNPFRVVSLSPNWLAWNDGTFVKIADAIYKEQQYENMPILADALQDSGCDDADILSHCRVETHFSNCWVLRLIRERGRHLLPANAVIVAVFPRDLEYMIEMTRRALQHYGITVLWTEDVRKAIQLYERGEVDVVFLNYALCYKGELDLGLVEYAFNNLKRLDPNVRCIVTSVCDPVNLPGMEGLIRRGLVFLSKPWQHEELRQVIYFLVGKD